MADNKLDFGWGVETKDGEWYLDEYNRFSSKELFTQGAGYRMFTKAGPAVATAKNFAPNSEIRNNLKAVKLS